MILIKNLGGVLQIEGLCDDTKIKIANSLKLDNPKFHTLKRMGNFRALKYTKPFIYYHKLGNNGQMLIGRGCQEGIQSYLTSQGLEFTYTESYTQSYIKTPIEVKATLRAYQEPVFEEFKLKDRAYGMIQLNTGWGKTLFAIKLIELYKQKTLIIVPREHLLTQFQEDIFRFTSRQSGTIQAQEFDIQDITIGTIETVKKHIKKIKDKFGMIIVDEAHLSCTPQIIKAIEELNPSRLYGMSGSPMRSDGQHEALKWIFGKPIVEDYMKHATPTIEIYHSNVHIPVRDYPSIIEEQVNNKERNDLVLNITKDLIKKGRTVLVLTKRVLHTQTLDELSREYGIIPIYADTPKDVKAELLDKLRKGQMEYNGLLGTAALLGTGTDLNKIDSVIISCDIKSKSLLIQCIGRALRLLEGKPDPLIIDIDDNLNPVLHRQHLERMKYYKEKGWIIKEMNVKQKYNLY